MASVQSRSGEPPSIGERLLEVECPRCRKRTDVVPQQRPGRCPACGLRLVVSIRESEADAWRRLYGRPAP